MQHQYSTTLGLFVISKQHYCLSFSAEKSNILLNKIQYVSMILAVLNSFLYSKNTGVYIIASNKKFLSIDIITELRGDQITFKSIFLRTIKDVVN